VLRIKGSFTRQLYVGVQGQPVPRSHRHTSGPMSQISGSVGNEMLVLGGGNLQRPV